MDGLQRRVEAGKGKKNWGGGEYNILFSWKTKFGYSKYAVQYYVLKHKLMANTRNLIQNTISNN